jgi:hypothetical protein
MSFLSRQLLTWAMDTAGSERGTGKLWLDPVSANAAIGKVLPEDCIIEKPSPLALAKAVKVCTFLSPKCLALPEKRSIHPCFPGFSLCCLDYEPQGPSPVCFPRCSYYVCTSSTPDSTWAKGWCQDPAKGDCSGAFTLIRFYVRVCRTQWSWTVCEQPISGMQWPWSSSWSGSTMRHVSTWRASFLSELHAGRLTKLEPESRISEQLKYLCIELTSVE